MKSWSASLLFVTCLCKPSVQLNTSTWPAHTQFFPHEKRRQKTRYDTWLLVRVRPASRPSLCHPNGLRDLKMFNFFFPLVVPTIHISFHAASLVNWIIIRFHPALMESNSLHFSCFASLVFVLSLCAIQKAGHCNERLVRRTISPRLKLVCSISVIISST